MPGRSVAILPLADDGLSNWVPERFQVVTSNARLPLRPGNAACARAAIVSDAMTAASAIDHILITVVNDRIRPRFRPLTC